jgi:hypothetical protein
MQCALVDQSVCLCTYIYMIHAVAVSFLSEQSEIPCFFCLAFSFYFLQTQNQGLEE